MNRNDSTNTPCNRPDFRAGAIVDGMYTVDKLLGEGTFGLVYRVRSAADDHYYALKLLKLWTVSSNERKRLRERFEQEYATGLIHSPYLVQAKEKGIVEGNPYILMEFCPGGDLAYAVEHRTIDLVEACVEVLQGLGTLHVNGKVHRDLKPENVLIKADRKAALTDFGIAGDRNKRLTERGVLGVPKEVLGTYAYMPPEQVNPKRGDSTVLPTTDIFSFGVMVYQLLTGHLPFGSLCNESDLPAYVTRGKTGDWDRERLRSVPSGTQWESVIDGCLHPDFRKRLQTVTEVMKRLPRRPGPVRDEDHGRIIIPISVPPAVNGFALRVMQGEEYGKVYKLNELADQSGRNVLTVGRLDPYTHNAIAIKEEQSHYISRRHATLEYDPGHRLWHLRDGQWNKNATGQWRVSTNGTYVGSTEVCANGIIIKVGDIISIGDVKMRLEGY